MLCILQVLMSTSARKKTADIVFDIHNVVSLHRWNIEPEIFYVKLWDKLFSMYFIFACGGEDLIEIYIIYYSEPDVEWLVCSIKKASICLQESSSEGMFWDVEKANPKPGWQTHIQLVHITELSTIHTGKFKKNLPINYKVMSWSFSIIKIFCPQCSKHEKKKKIF